MLTPILIQISIRKIGLSVKRGDEELTQCRVIEPTVCRMQQHVKGIGVGDLFDAEFLDLLIGVCGE